MEFTRENIGTYYDVPLDEDREKVLALLAEGYTCTDPDQLQFGKRVGDGVYEFAERVRFNPEQEGRWVEIRVDLSHYDEAAREYHVSAYYGSMAELADECDDDTEWMLAECIFENESGQY
jgi:hypothetical protein